MLTLSDIAYRYPDAAKPVLTGFSLRLEAGRVRGLLGPNGAGKSTVLGLAAGWLKPDRGQRICAVQTAWLPQAERLSFAFTCLEYVLFGRAPHLPYLAVPQGDDEAAALIALERAGMADKADRRITTLSGGELQLVRLARCIAQQAPVLLLDEPTDMLDPAHVVQVADIIRQLAGDGCAVLLTTHDIHFALACADDASLLRDGSSLADGPAAAVLDCANLERAYGVPFRQQPVPTPYLPGRT